ncbi:aminoacyl-tRNA hydrolase [Enterobacteriaceae endosymbiont of Plateumaris consimilis]|uniref:aminoacyl-tRNA hydrolase n=1 Tax=Enterobacteriaceae endosymbiont of Plateumaris consimilis TaxID=2675794 RepID=UPI001448BEB5|nr:aminoacyl-tRNA hydrolase [Enterobacteriaceae endosymbiont of Plateumaris consimilis]QJC28516.1 aminoacyl-tRNA hydrolase [Enterobacteriaceae endosymbiont of Plateumaris consimilis]
MSNIKMIVGLGNIGKKFVGSRHNMGSDYIYYLANYFKIKLNKIEKLHSYIGYIFLSNKKLILLIPDTFMNNSGKSILLACNFYKIILNNVLIIHDELDFLPGKIKFKYGGGSGGHNGLNDIIKNFNNKLFYRLRIGIGHPVNKLKVNNFVLNKPTIIEKKIIKHAMKNIMNAIKIFIDIDYYRAMNYLHSK